MQTHQRFISVGYGNAVACDRVVAVVSPDSAPVKRLMQDAKEDGRAIDVSCGRKTRSVIITDSEHVIFSALPSEKITARLNGEENVADE